MVRYAQKYKSTILNILVLMNKMAQISNIPKPASSLVMTQASRTQIAEDKITSELQRVSEPQRAPVVRV